MSEPTKKNRDSEREAAGGDPPPDCGLVMPISATANHNEKHWADVQTLLHRGVRLAGMNPVNVWTGELTDRISERIVGNIFSNEIVVVDISDLNPNVMLELGLRLASKKPTIVVVESGGTIPFDIRDFNAIIYPADLNILGMESFFEKFSSSLKSKIEAFRNGKYSPFLGHVVVDVISPEIRQVSMNELVIDRLDELGSRLSRIERQKPISPSRTRNRQSTIYSNYRDGARTYYFSISNGKEEIAQKELSKIFDRSDILVFTSELVYLVGVSESGTPFDADLEPRSVIAIEKLGGSPGIPSYLLEMIEGR